MPLPLPSVAANRAPASRLLVESLAVGTAVWLVYLLLRPDPLATLGALYDDVRYMSLAKAIASGEGYRMLHLVHQPVDAMAPPGLPVILAVAWRFGRDLATTSAIALVLNTIAVGAAAAVLWWFSRRHLGNGRLTTAVFAIGPLLLQQAMRYWSGAMTEPWFLLGWITALVLFEHATSDADNAHRLRMAAVLGLVVAATALFRTQALVLIGALPAAFVLTQRAWKAACICAVAALGPLVVWQYWLSHAVLMDRAGRPALPGQSSYLEMIPKDGISGLAAYLWTAIRFQLGEYPPLAASMFTGWPSPKAYMVLLAFSALVVWGCWRLAREHTALVLSLAAVIGLLLVWSTSEARYVAPVLPVAGLAAAYAVERAIAARSGFLRRAVQGGILVVAVLVAIVNAKLVRDQRAPEASARGTFVSAFRDVSAWILANTRLDDRILIEYGAGYYLRTGRQTVIAVPEDGGVGRVGSIDTPGRYFAQRILQDSVTVIVNQRPAGLNGVLISASLSRIAEACPRVLQPEEPIPTAGDSVPPAYYRVARDEACLRSLAGR